MKAFRPAVLVLCLLLSLTAASAAAKVNIYFIPKQAGSALGAAAGEGAQACAEANGFRVTVEAPAEATVKAQSAAARAAVNNGADALCIDPVDAGGLAGALKDAEEGGLVVTAWESAAAEAGCLSVCPGAPEEMGGMLVSLLAASLEERGKDPAADEIRYCWHCGLEGDNAERAWSAAGEAVIAAQYPNWINVAPDHYYSKADAKKAVSTGMAILAAHPDIDGILCCDDVALQGQAQALIKLGRTWQDVAVTGLATPGVMKPYLESGAVKRFGLWDCRLQGALASALTFRLVMGEEIRAGDFLEIDGLGSFEVQSAQAADAAGEEDGVPVVLLPERIVFTADNIDQYDF